MQELENIVAEVGTGLEEKKRIEERQFANLKWEVVQSIEKVEPRIYSIMKKIHADIVVEELTIEGEKKECMKWNPVKEILRHRRLIDPYRHVDFGAFLDFCATKMSIRYPTIVIDEFQNPEKYPALKRAINIIGKYMRPFSNKRYRYTWYDWFWISAYCEAEGAGKAISLLRKLDGRDVRLSRKYIKARLQPTFEFWEEFLKYTAYFFKFIKRMLHIIESDVVLKKQFDETLNEGRIENENIVEDMVGQHLERICKLQAKQPRIDCNTSAQGPNSDNVDGNDNFRLRRIRPERIRINHYNPDYQKEKIEYENKVRKELPWRRKRCGPFKPSEFPPHALVQLVKEGRLKI